MTPKKSPRQVTEGKKIKSPIHSNKLADACQVAIRRQIEAKGHMTYAELRAVVRDWSTRAQLDRALQRLAETKLISLNPRRDGIVVRAKVQRGANDAEQ